MMDALAAQTGWLLADRGYDADWYRETSQDTGIKPCIPGRKFRGKIFNYDKRRYLFPPVS